MFTGPFLFVQFDIATKTCPFMRGRVRISVLEGFTLVLVYERRTAYG